jgi:hypothetical protein
MDFYSPGELGTGTAKPEVTRGVSRIDTATVIFRLNLTCLCLGVKHCRILLLHSLPKNRKYKVFPKQILRHN